MNLVDLKAMIIKFSCDQQVSQFKILFQNSFHFFKSFLVLVSDSLIFFSALYYYWMILFDSYHSDSDHFLNNLLIPSLILIDHGHFQYNCIALGLFLWTVICLTKRQDVLASILFCLAFNYKQMALYYSLPIFFFLLKRCYNRRSFLSIISKFIIISLAVIITMVILWSPYLEDFNTILQVVRRIFPLNRGIYEDKVSNFWYCLSVFIKVKNYFTEDQLAWMRFVIILIFIF